MSCNNIECMKLLQIIGWKWVKYVSIVLVLMLLKHCNIWKTGVAVKICFAVVLTVLGESSEVICSFSKMLEEYC